MIGIIIFRESECLKSFRYNDLQDFRPFFGLENSNIHAGAYLSLTRSIGLPPHAPVAQKNADWRPLIGHSAKIGTFLYKMVWLEVGECE